MNMLNTTPETGSSLSTVVTMVTQDSFTVRDVTDNASQLDRHNFTDTSSTTQDLINYFNDIKTYIHTFVPPMLITVGVFCNLLSLVVWVRGLLKKRGSSSSYFFACLAIADIIALLSVPLYDHIANAYYIYKRDHSIYVDLRTFSNFLCKLYSFIFLFSLSFTSYILASLALFRMIGIIYPHRYKQVCSHRNAKIIIPCIIAFTVLAHIQVIFRAKLVNLPGVGIVCAVPNNEGFARLFGTVMVTVLDFLVPMVIIVLCNIGIIWKLVRRRSHSDRSRKVNKGDHAFSRTVIVLVAVSLVYIITMSPMFVGIVLNAYINWRATPAVQLAKYKLFYALAINICLLNSSTNFFTYCLAHPQFVPEVKLCFAALAAKVSSMFQKCKNRNTVGVIHVREVKVATASASDKVTKLATASSSGKMTKLEIASLSGIKPKCNTTNEIDIIISEA